MNAEFLVEFKEKDDKKIAQFVHCMRYLGANFSYMSTNCDLYNLICEDVDLMNDSIMGSTSLYSYEDRVLVQQKERMDWINKSISSIAASTGYTCSRMDETLTLKLNTPIVDPLVIDRSTHWCNIRLSDSNDIITIKLMDGKFITMDLLHKELST